MKYLGRSFGLLVVPASLFVFAGCGSAAAPDGTGQTSATQQSTAPAAKLGGGRALRARMPRGPAIMVLRTALADLELDATQKKTIQGLIDQLKPERDATHAQLSHALAQAVRSGNVDSASFTDQYAAMEKQVKNRVDKQAAALDQLHATLGAADRGLLVDQLEARLDKRPDFARRASPGRHGHWIRRQPAGPGATAPDARGLHRGGPPMMMGGFMAHKLGLSQEQIAKLREQAPALEPKRGDCSGHMGAHRADAKKLLEGFASDDFKAEKLIDADAVARRASGFAQKRVEHLARLVGVLTPDQRTQLAGMLDRRAGATP